MMGSDGTSDGGPTRLDGFYRCSRCRMLQHNAKVRKCSMQGIELGQERVFSVEDVYILELV